MFRPEQGPVAVKATPRLGLLGLTFCAFLALACGVPLSASELTATVQQGNATPNTLVLGVAVETSNVRASDVSVGIGSPSPTITVTTTGTRTTTTATATTTAASTAPGTTATPTPTQSAVATPQALLASSLTTTTPTSATTGTATATTTATATQTATATSSAGASAAPNSTQAAQVLELVNAYRAEKGLTQLRMDASLNKAALSYAQFMANQGFFGHDGPDGSNPNSRISGSGYAGACEGEALVAGFATAAGAVDAWKNSAPHNAVLLDPVARDVGIGYFYKADDPLYKHYWVLDTGAPSSLGCTG